MNSTIKEAPNRDPAIIASVCNWSTAPASKKATLTAATGEPLIRIYVANQPKPRACTTVWISSNRSTSDAALWAPILTNSMASTNSHRLTKNSSTRRIRLRSAASRSRLGNPQAGRRRRRVAPFSSPVGVPLGAVCITPRNLS